MSVKTYTARNVREFLDREVGTVPKNILARVLREYTEAVVRCEAVGLSPYRYEPQHARREDKMPYSVDPNGLADDIDEHGLGYKTTARVTLERTDDGNQVIEFRVLITDYVVEVDTDRLVFEE